jgi:hypothetical protein
MELTKLPKRNNEEVYESSPNFKKAKLNETEISITLEYSSKFIEISLSGDFLAEIKKIVEMEFKLQNPLFELGRELFTIEGLKGMI